jgi:hypothetical protein
MTLAEKLDQLRAASANRIPPEKRAIMSAVTQAQRESGVLDGVLKVGQKLPDFSLTDQHGAEIHSRDLLARGPLVLSVFRGVW